MKIVAEEIKAGNAGTTASLDASTIENKPVEKGILAGDTDIAEPTDTPPAVSAATVEEIASAQALSDAGESVTVTLLQGRLRIGYQQAKRIHDAWTAGGAVTTPPVGVEFVTPNLAANPEIEVSAPDDPQPHEENRAIEPVLVIAQKQATSEVA